MDSYLASLTEAEKMQVLYIWKKKGELGIYKVSVGTCMHHQLINQPCSHLFINIVYNIRITLLVGNFISYKFNHG